MTAAITRPGQGGFPRASYGLFDGKVAGATSDVERDPETSAQAATLASAATSSLHATCSGRRAASRTAGVEQIAASRIVRSRP